MSPPKFLPNLSADGKENATFEAKNTNPHAPIPKPGCMLPSDVSGKIFCTFAIVGYAIHAATVPLQFNTGP